MAKSALKKDNFISKRRRGWALYLLCFFAVGIFDAVDFFPATQQPSHVLYALWIIMWASMVKTRIVNNRVRHHFQFIVLFALLFIVLRVCRYAFFPGDFLARQIWYWYYIPVILISLFSFRVSVLLLKNDVKSKDGWNLLFIPAAVLCGLFCTNDFHQLAFSFGTNFADWEHNYVRGPVYYLTAVWICGCVGYTLYMVIKLSKSHNILKSIWIPLLPIVLGALYFTFFDRFTDRYISIEFPEMFCFMFIGFWEGCIVIGLINSNNNYRKIFKSSHIFAQLVDRQGKTVLASENAINLEDIDLSSEYVNDNILLHRHDIRGGQIYWTEDISLLNELNDKLADINTILAEESDLLKAENQLKEEHAIIEEQTRIYDKIADSVNKQRIKIGLLINEAENDPSKYDKNMLLVSFYAVYIKRRANLTLLAAKDTVLHAQELVLSINESLDYLNRLGIPTYHLNTVSVWLPSDILIKLYDLFEVLIEKALPGLSGLIVKRNVTSEYFEIKLSVETPSNIMEELSDSIDLEMVCEEEAVYYSLRYYFNREGGKKS